MPTHVFEKDNVNEYARQNRERAYKDKTDAMYMMALRGEIPMSDWEAAVAEIKARFPYVTEDLVLEAPEPEPWTPTYEFDAVEELKA